MLNNKIVFARLIALLENLNPEEKFELPEDLKDYLWKYMIVENLCKKPVRFEKEGKTPKNAYYVVRGFVVVFGYNDDTERYVFRIYRENTIVAMDCFMRQQKSFYCIWGCKDTLLWSISAAHMDYIYENWGLRSFALETASKHNAAKERSRASLLGIEDVEMRVLEFYRRYKVLLPARNSPIRDACIASFLRISVSALKHNRDALLQKKLLP
jgi:CRP-like cAMP-binding protein